MSLRVASWLWALSAAPGAAGFVIVSITRGYAAVVSTPPGWAVFTTVFLSVVVLLVWGLRVVCAVLLTGPRGNLARAVLLVGGLLVGVGNDIGDMLQVGGAPGVMVLAGIDLVLIVAGTVSMYRPAGNAFLRDAAASARDRRFGARRAG